MRSKHLKLFFKTCSKCRQSCNDIDAIIPCGGWNNSSCKKGSYEYWIHKSIDCCQTEDYVNYCPSSFITLNSLPNDDNTRPVNEFILRMARIDDDVITECNSDGLQGASFAQIVIGESCKSVCIKLNKINEYVDSCGNDNGSRPRSSGVPPIIMGIPNSLPTSTLEEKNILQQHQLMFIRIMKLRLTIIFWHIL